MEQMVEGFVVKLFDEVEGLREYYLKYCGGGGEFVCLICGGVGEKCGKRFKDCVALVQHSVAIAKTKKRRSHRAFGKVVCKVLGWEIDRLPVSSVLEQRCNGLEGGDGNVGKDVNDLNGVVDGANSVGRTSDGAEGVEGECESMVCEDITTVANEEHNKNQVLNEAEVCTGGAVNNLVRITLSLNL
ncbi:hypothetical protein M8C21_016174 [Ambrosia artemisiifolia]|uniref:Uncharacterized protein n=1 Tax=Ambrosia artemisiifolia TaxID=4212 RepID=A0AAD5CD14_AMBAR|nr:hypothetical protein M8C21_016174 [Ambrosia artemisiifolia]